jgi:hypothetical protein
MPIIELAGLAQYGALLNAGVGAANLFLNLTKPSEIERQHKQMLEFVKKHGGGRRPRMDVMKLTSLFSIRALVWSNLKSYFVFAFVSSLAVAAVAAYAIPQDSSGQALLGVRNFESVDAVLFGLLAVTPFANTRLGAAYFGFLHHSNIRDFVRYDAGLQKLLMEELVFPSMHAFVKAAKDNHITPISLEAKKMADEEMDRALKALGLKVDEMRSARRRLPPSPAKRRL